MRRGGTLRPPRPRAPAATRPVPPFRPSEGQVSPGGAGEWWGESWRTAHLLNPGSGGLGMAVPAHWG